MYLCCQDKKLCKGTCPVLSVKTDGPSARQKDLGQWVLVQNL
jgi:hypothetical protein